MKRLLLALLFLPAFALAQTPPAHTYTVNWTAPTQYVGGAVIPSGTAITYNWYVGTGGPGSESSTPLQTGIRYLSAVASGFAAGQNVCSTVTAVVNGVESPHSNEACSVIPSSQPGAPTHTTSSAT